MNDEKKLTNSFFIFILASDLTWVTIESIRYKWFYHIKIQLTYQYVELKLHIYVVQELSANSLQVWPLQQHPLGHIQRNGLLKYKIK